MNDCASQITKRNEYSISCIIKYITNLFISKYSIINIQIV